MAQSSITHYGEFIDVLHSLCRNNPIVVTGDRHAVIDGNMIYFSLPVLHEYGIVEEFKNKDGFPFVVYLRITQHGREFAERVISTWNSSSLLCRLFVRLM